MRITNAAWISSTGENKTVCPVFRRGFRLRGPLQRAFLEITCLGVYEAELNGRRVGNFVLAPGWTSYAKRLQVQTYEITELLQEENELRVTVGKGWFRSPMPGFVQSEEKARRMAQRDGLIAALRLEYADGTAEDILTDASWQWAESAVRFSEIYDGEHFDAGVVPKDWQAAELLAWPKDILIPQEGEEIRETERLQAKCVFTAPNGETIVDFGQEVTGWVEFSVQAEAGAEVLFDHGEVLDSEGNFYHANYRSAKAEVRYICREGFQTWHPHLTFFGFRYIRLRKWPGRAEAAAFTAAAVHSQMQRTGWIGTSDPLLNRLISNIFWGQRGNFLDVPTDCPQRDERLGWTGDAQVFVKAASYNYDVERFFRKWLRDLAADQRESGEVGQVIPDVMPDAPGSAAWGDAAVICPWQIYQSYGDRSVLEEQYDSMCRWVDYIAGVTETPDLWTGHFHFGDWLGLDAPSGSYTGSSRKEFIASAFFARSTELVIRAGKLLGRDTSAYEEQYKRTVSRFRLTYPVCLTQTEHVLAVQFGLAEDPQKTADALADMIVKDGTQLRTGFVGTPYLLHVLSDYGHAELAWKLLMRREYPGWLYAVGRGATTVWEHWDGMREDGSFWSTDMNSFNHYAYGAVIDWIYEKAAGISHREADAGFSRLVYAPQPDPCLEFLTAERMTRHGMIRSSWRREADGFRIELTTPVPAEVILDGQTRTVEPGQYTFWTSSRGNVQ